MEQAHLSSDKASNGQIAPGALVEMQAAFFGTFRSASRCWLAMAQAQAVAGFAIARILSTKSGQEAGNDMKENDISDLTPCEEVELLHIME